jgi:hypothetical protein
MGWCRDRYYQRSHKVNGRVVTEYLGVGFEYLALEDARAREGRRAAALKARQEAAAQGDLLRGERAVARVLDDLRTRSLHALWFSQHDRGPWTRRRRMASVPSVAPEDGSLPPAAREAIADELLATVKATMAGEKGALERLRALGAAHPRAMVLATRADLEKIAAEVLAKEYSGRPELAAFREGTLRRYEQVFADLAGENPSAARRVCAWRAAYAELESWVIGMKVAAANPAPKSLLARLTAAERRLMTALKTLEQIRVLESIGTRPIVAAPINLSPPPPESQRSQLFSPPDVGANGPGGEP